MTVGTPLRRVDLTAIVTRPMSLEVSVGVGQKTALNLFPLTIEGGRGV
jgi:hypothetical protein